MTALARFMAKSGRELVSDDVRRLSTVAIHHDGKLLMGRRRDNGKWTTPGGHAEDDETPHQAAVREVKEESGLRVSEAELKHLGDEKVKDDKGHIHVSAFRVDMGGARPKPDAHQDPDAEIGEWKWVDCKDGIPPWIAGNMHVPLERNVLMKKLGHGRASTALDRFRAKGGQ